MSSITPTFHEVSSRVQYLICTLRRLASTGLGDDECCMVADAVRASISLADIDLSDNAIGTIGARSLSDALRCSACMQCLKLRHNCISDGGAAAIAESFWQAPLLTTVE
jgi:Ran GTPase-activating protein (RanGAP) involved in mRNA processing and transport